MVLTFLAAILLGHKPLPFPKAWLGRWEGPAVLAGWRERMRLVFLPNGKVEISEIERVKDGHLWRRATMCDVLRTRQGYELGGQGSVVDADGPHRGMVGDDVVWHLRHVRLTAGVLSGMAREGAEDSRSDWDRFVLRHLR